MLAGYEIPPLGRPTPRPGDRADKPGHCLVFRFSRLPYGPIRWTRYGCWDDDCSTVRNHLGQPIYEAGSLRRIKRK